MFSSAGGQMPISPKMKNNLKALAEDADMPDSTRRVVREYVSRWEEVLPFWRLTRRLS